MWFSSSSPMMISLRRFKRWWQADTGGWPTAIALLFVAAFFYFAVFA